MVKKHETHFFLGSNSPSGFYSLYDKFTDPEKDVLYIIKGGPGSGKSTFMRTVADAVQSAGMSAEYIHCSGDPDSLDGVYFPDLNTAYVDGTAPHVIEPRYAGSADRYVSLNDFYDTGALEKKNAEIMRCTSAYKAYYKRAYKLISSAAGILEATKPVIPEDAVLTAARRTQGIICREIRPSGKKYGKTSFRFLGAVTHKGAVCLFDTVRSLAERVYVLDNELGMAPIVVEAVSSAAEGRGYDVIRCLSPMSPGVTEHVIIPELSLAFVSQTSAMTYDGPSFRHLRLDAIPDSSVLASVRKERKEGVKLYDAAMVLSVNALGSAKSLHDRLESLYNPHVDFDGVRALAEKHARSLVG